MAKNILIIDDDDAVRKAFTLAFKDTQYNVDTAESGRIGLQMEKRKKYDLIFLDLKMPEINGIEVLYEIRKTDKNIPIYIITAFHKEFFSELREAEMDGIRFQIIKKPICKDRIVLLASSILEKPYEY